MVDHNIVFRQTQVQSTILYDAIPFQQFLLQCIGFLPVGAKSESGTVKNVWAKYLTSVLTVIGSLWLLACWVSFGFNAAVAIGALTTEKDPHTNETDNSIILETFSQLPFATYNFRGVVIASVVFVKRRSWTKLVFLVNNVLHSTKFPVGNAEALYKWKLLAGVCAIVTLMSCLIWESFNNLSYMQVYKKTLYSDGILDPLPVSMLVWQYDTFWTVCSSLPFYLSQQVFICFIIIAKILTDSCHVLSKILHEKVEKMKYCVAGTHRTKDSQLTLSELETLVPEVVEIKRRYLEMCMVCDYFNGHFGSTIFFLYGLDLLTMFGCVASIVSGDRSHIPMAQGYYFCSVIIFLLHCTLFMWPLVLSYEEGLKVNVVLHDFVGLIETGSVLQTAQGKHLHSVLYTFVTSSKDRMMLFSGAEILHVTRTFVFTTFTLLVSFTVITKEILDRENTMTMCQHLN